MLCCIVGSLPSIFFCSECLCVQELVSGSSRFDMRRAGTEEKLSQGAASYSRSHLYHCRPDYFTAEDTREGLRLLNLEDSTDLNVIVVYLQSGSSAQNFFTFYYSSNLAY